MIVVRILRMMITRRDCSVKVKATHRRKHQMAFDRKLAKKNLKELKALHQMNQVLLSVAKLFNRPALLKEATAFASKLDSRIAQWQMKRNSFRRKANAIRT